MLQLVSIAIISALFAVTSASECGFCDDEVPTDYAYNFVAYKALDPSIKGCKSDGMSLMPLSCNSSELGVNWKFNVPCQISQQDVKVDELKIMRKYRKCGSRVVYLKDLHFKKDPATGEVIIPPELRAVLDLLGFREGGIRSFPIAKGKYALKEHKLTKVPALFKKGSYYISLILSLDCKPAIHFFAEVEFW